MKEKIYTIPVTEVFNADCDCPLCLLEERIEKEAVDYYLGPALMEPEHRVDTNNKGFCRKHFEILYRRQENTLGLALIIETHLEKLRGDMRTAFDKFARNQAGAAKRKNPDLTSELISELSSEIKKRNDSCVICDILAYTMGRYIDIIFYLWQTEPEFTETFNNRKGFCQVHFAALLNGAVKYLKSPQRGEFTDVLFKMQLDSLDVLQDDIDWFAKKFDYRNQDAPWKNSKGAVQRSIRKLVGYFRER